MKRTEQLTNDGKPRVRRYVPGRAQARTRPDSTAPAVAPGFFSLPLPRGVRGRHPHHSGLQGVWPANVTSRGRTLAGSPSQWGDTGFTLTELLVVILIVGLLVAVAVSALLGALGTSSAAATRALVEKLDRGLQDRLASVENRKIDVLGVDTALAFDGDNQLGDDSSDEPLRAMVLAKKRLLKEEFPQWFEVVRDAAGNVVDVVGDWDPLWVDWNSNGMVDVGVDLIQSPAQLSPVAQGYRNWILNIATRDAMDNNGNGVVDEAAEQAFSLTQYLANHDPRTTSAECLYLILTLGPGASSVDPVEFAHREIEDTDGDGLPELIDGNGLPIRFFRWPTHYRSGLQKGDGPYQVGERREEDPTDQNRLLVLWPWWQTNPNDGINRRLLFENARSVSALTGAIGPFAFHNLSEFPTADGRDNDGNGSIDDAGEDALAWSWSASLAGPNPNYGAAAPVRAREFYMQPLIVSSGPDEQFGLDVRAVFYLQARVLSDWADVFPTTMLYQAAVQGDPFALSMGGFDEQVGAHLDNITNHDLRSDQ